ncbi:hypothetical protein [Glaciihabitans tibetensis]|nr:hypothetical protein [Glaciihabitans tibetensis]
MVLTAVRSGVRPARSIAPTVLLIGALLAAPVLAGCSGEQVQSIVGDATGGTVDVGGTTIPEDFPAEIPLASGEVASAGRVGTGTGKVWNITITVTDVAAPSVITEQLTSAGFASTSNLPGAPDIGGTAGFANDTYAVALIVNDNGDGTFAANYTVTTIPQ